MTLSLRFFLIMTIITGQLFAEAIPKRALPNVSKNAAHHSSPVKRTSQWQYVRTYSTAPNGAGMYALQAGNAKCTDYPNYTLETDTLQNWEHSNSTAEWKLDRLPFSTTYDIYVRYKSSSSAKVKVKVGGRSLSASVPAGRDAFTKEKVGSVKMIRGSLNTVEVSLENSFSSFKLQGVEVVPAQTPHRWFDTSNLTWTRDIPKDLRYTERIPDQMPPAHLIKNGPKGYAIITTEAIKKHSKVLGKFIQHKKSLGFTPYIVTEKQFGGGTGPDAADNIRKWLHSHYKKMKLLYVLLIGKPHPDSGTIPMMAEGTDMKAFRYQISQGEHPHARRATDMYYMDCSGPVIDLDGDGIFGSQGDFKPGEGLDNVWDVLAGRIPYYGEDSPHGKYADLDAILQKTINYENASFTEVLERYNFEVDGNILDGYTVEWGGFNYVTREQLGRGFLKTDHYSWLNNSFMDQYSVGFLRSGGHANPTFIESGISSGWLASRSVPKDTLNVVSVFGGCDCSQPEHSMNMGYMHLRKGAIVTQGASRSVASVRGVGERTRPQTFSDFRRNCLLRGYSVGQAHWESLSGGRRRPNDGAVMFTLYGDPSIVPFPQALQPKRDFIIRPVHTLQVHEPVKVAANTPYYKQEYDIQNLSGKKIKWKVDSQASWFSIRGQKTGILEPGKTQTIYTTFNPRSRTLPAGSHTASIKINLGGKVHYKSIELVKFTDEIAYLKTFEDASGKAYNPMNAEQKMKEELANLSGTDDQKRNAKRRIQAKFGSGTTIMPRHIHVFEAMNSSAGLEFKPFETYKGNPDIMTGIGFKLYINSTDQTIVLNWQPYEYGESAWSKRYTDMSKAPEDCIILKGKKPIRKSQWNTVVISIDYVNKRATMYLNGQLEATAKVPGYYYAFATLKMNGSLNAEFNSFKVTRAATTPQTALLNYKFGEPVNCPVPESFAVGETRQPTFKWTPSPSIAGIKKPEYRLFLSSDPKKLGHKTTFLGTTSTTELTLNRPLKGAQKYYWRVDTVSKDKTRKRTGKIWQFTTSRYLSEEVLTSTTFSDPKVWKGPAVGSNSDSAEFKNQGSYITQNLDKSKVIPGAYKITLNLSSPEQKITKPMQLTIHGDQDLLVAKKLELNQISGGKLTDYFFLKKKVGIYNKLYLKLSLPGQGRNAGYSVSLKNVSLKNAIDPRTVPDKPPVFRQLKFELPPMKAKDNSYSYFFIEDITDEQPKSVRFRMVEGPSWVSIQASGRVFSYYGAPKSAVGKHRIVVEARDAKGQTSKAFVTVEVKP